MVPTSPIRNPHPDNQQDAIHAPIAIIVAGGSGSRMQSALPKQFLLLDGKPVIMHTIAAFSTSDLKPAIILAIHPDYHNYWKNLCKDYRFDVPHTVVGGGETRFDSVKNALDTIKGDAVIAIHDAVRPFISNAIITNSFKTAIEKGSAITAIQSRDSVRQLSGSTSKALLRESIYLVQTPQTFRSDVIREAYKQPFLPEFTDDASVAEKSGHTITLIEGSTKNIKITFPEDLVIGSHYLTRD